MPSRQISSHAPFSTSPVFEALIVPYRSTTRRGVIWMAVAIVVLSLGVGMRFLLLGAWPVMLFSLLELPLLGVLLAINLRQTRASELILLDPRQITVTRTDPAGRQTGFSLPTAWLQINLEENRGASRVVLTTHGQGREIGGFLHEPEKASLCKALQRAVHDIRHPVFDNPQLRGL
ncbi:hypothetical protein CCS01_22485 [Rhodopila globiformis]|uniref:DUF2244 domain-containing protein n=1 Tax=Rhodopila globiformis TaxID=1071 RepID=A0A2S6N3H3_RHOGL|nr:hypothetical protein CCS01_22485 [Rhodopila globiformis]